MQLGLSHLGFCHGVFSTWTLQVSWVSLQETYFLMRVFWSKTSYNDLIPNSKKVTKSIDYRFSNWNFIQFGLSLMGLSHGAFDTWTPWVNWVPPRETYFLMRVIWLNTSFNDLISTSKKSDQVSYVFSHWNFIQLGLGLMGLSHGVFSTWTLTVSRVPPWETYFLMRVIWLNTSFNDLIPTSKKLPNP